MEELFQAIDEALQRKGLSAAAASRLAVGNAAAIKNLMARRSSNEPQKSHPIENLIAVARVLDLELYLGPRREPGRVDPVFEIDGEAFAALPFYDVELSAGPGRTNEREEVVERVAFRRDWLQEHGVALDRGCLVKVRGDSMAPRLSDGDLVLVDRAKDEVRDGGIYALVDADHSTRVKRLNRPDRRSLILSSDNPDYPIEFRRGPDLAALRIIGEMVWSGHTWR